MVDEAKAEQRRELATRAREILRRATVSTAELARAAGLHPRTVAWALQPQYAPRVAIESYLPALAIAMREKALELEQLAAELEHLIEAADGGLPTSPEAGDKA